GIGEGDRNFFRHAPLRRRRAACTIGKPHGWHDWRSALHYSAASSGLAMRRVCSERSSYSRCQSLGPFEGPTWTAVTLYSGQLVAQAEQSVVMTLACVSGWWNVV